MESSTDEDGDLRFPGDRGRHHLGGPQHRHLVAGDDHDPEVDETGEGPSDVVGVDAEHVGDTADGSPGEGQQLLVTTFVRRTHPERGEDRDGSSAWHRVAV